MYSTGLLNDPSLSASLRTPVVDPHMERAAKPLLESERIAALRAFEVLDTAPEPAYDDIVAIAAELCDTPIALISLVDDDRQWFKAKVGLDATQTSRDVAFCAHAILDDCALVIPDATLDPRFADNPLVTEEPHVRFYAGAPLVEANGHALGTLCVIDQKPRTVSSSAMRALEALGRRVVAELELKRTAAQLSDALERARLLGELLPMCSWCRRIRDDQQYWHRVEAYFEKQTGTEFTHCICSDCMVKHYPGAASEQGNNS